MAENKLGESREDYLEAIYMQINAHGACRPTDVANQLGCSKPSVSVALKKLEEEGYIIRDDWRVELTDAGKSIAQGTFGKHSFFKNWLMMAGVDEKTASAEACRIEHVISDESFEKVVSFMRTTHGNIFDNI